MCACVCACEIVFNKQKNGKFKQKGVSGEDRSDTEGMVSPTTLIDSSKGLTHRQEREERMVNRRKKTRKKGELIICHW